MDETVTVALITALATLAGGGMASLVAVRNAREERRFALARANLERMERREGERRELRRNAYLQFIDQLDATERAVLDLWLTEALEQPVNVRAYEPFTAASRQLDELGARAHRVALEGPEDMYTAALRCVLAEGHALAALGELIDRSVGFHGELGTLHSDERVAQNAVRHRHKTAFIEAARRVVEQDSRG